LVGVTKERMSQNTRYKCKKNMGTSFQV